MLSKNDNLWKYNSANCLTKKFDIYSSACLKKNASLGKIYSLRHLSLWCVLRTYKLVSSLKCKCSFAVNTKLFCFLLSVKGDGGVEVGVGGDGWVSASKFYININTKENSVNLSFNWFEWGTSWMGDKLTNIMDQLFLLPGCWEDNSY